MAGRKAVEVSGSGPMRVRVVRWFGVSEDGGVLSDDGKSRLAYPNSSVTNIGGANQISSIKDILHVLI
jgi:hypothetical protein